MFPDDGIVEVLCSNRERLAAAAYGTPTLELFPGHEDTRPAQLVEGALDSLLAHHPADVFPPAAGTLEKPPTPLTSTVAALVTEAGASVAPPKLGDTVTKEGVKLRDFFQAMVRAWFLLLRTEEWGKARFTMSSDLMGKEFINIKIAKSKADAFGHGFVTELTCCCDIGPQQQAAPLATPTQTPICPVHSVKQSVWEAIAKIPSPKKTNIFRELLLRSMGEVGLEFIRQQHQLYLVRIGAAQSMIDAGCTVTQLRVAGRWSGDEVALGYSKDAHSAPSMLRLERWPFRQPAVLFKDMLPSQVHDFDIDLLSRKRRKLDEPLQQLPPPTLAAPTAAAPETQPSPPATVTVPEEAQLSEEVQQFPQEAEASSSGSAAAAASSESLLPLEGQESTAPNQFSVDVGQGGWDGSIPPEEEAFLNSNGGTQ